MFVDETSSCLPINNYVNEESHAGNAETDNDETSNAYVGTARHQVEAHVQAWRLA